MKFLLPVALLAAVTAAPAFADCVAPTISINIPDGTKAALADMLATQHAIKDADAAAAQFTDCLTAERDAKIAAGGTSMKDEDKIKISTEYADRQNEVADKLQKLADQFNVEVRAFKAKAAAAAPPAATPAATPAAPAAQPTKP
ncbi:MAG: hypothetical protein JSR15_02455 [Proteobacteria bacterium]|nr:hypothetical protein [Pseudomonadota bacterium]